MKRFLPVLGALVPPPPSPKEVVFQYAELAEANLTLDSLKVVVEPFALAGVPDLVRAHMRPSDLTAAFATFAAGGGQRRTHFVAGGPGRRRR